MKNIIDEYIAKENSPFKTGSECTLIEDSGFKGSTR